MNPVHFLQKSLRFLPLLALPLLVWLWPIEREKGMGEDFSDDKINLALRRAADGLLRDSGDSTSRIPAVEKVSQNVWRVRLERPFRYEKLPVLLQNALDLHGIQQSYEVAVRRCEDARIDLGYHQMDFLKRREDDFQSDSLPKNAVPCSGRAMPEGCHFIEIVFLDKVAQKPFLLGFPAFLCLILGGLAVFWLFRNQKARLKKADEIDETDWIEFGNSRLDALGQTLVCGAARQKLTFREAKLLRLFVSSPDRLLERDFILQQVWADEGILVSRSIDVFVSRLRKKLAADPTVAIVAVHGIGYRLETGRQ